MSADKSPAERLDGLEAAATGLRVSQPAYRYVIGLIVVLIHIVRDIEKRPTGVTRIDPD